MRKRSLSSDRRLPLAILVVFWVIAAFLLAFLCVGLASWALTGHWRVWEAPQALPGVNDSGRSGAIKAGLLLVAGIGAVVGLVLSYRRQRFLETDKQGQRDQARLHYERYQQAAVLMGETSPMARIAGVQAMAALADEWPEGRQQCVDVLTGYLRLPPLQGPGDSQVRATLCRAIALRLRTPEVRWRGVFLDFTGASIVSAEFSNCDLSTSAATFSHAEFLGLTDFRGCRFGPKTSFNGASFRTNAQFGWCVFERQAWFLGSSFQRGASFEGAVFEGDALFGLTSFKGTTYFSGASFLQDAEFATSEGHDDLVFTAGLSYRHPKDDDPRTQALLGPATFHRLPIGLNEEQMRSTLLVGTESNPSAR